MLCRFHESLSGTVSESTPIVSLASARYGELMKVLLLAKVNWGCSLRCQDALATICVCAPQSCTPVVHVYVHIHLQADSSALEIQTCKAIRTHVYVTECMWAHADLHLALGIMRALMTSSHVLPGIPVLLFFVNTVA